MPGWEQRPHCASKVPISGCDVLQPDPAIVSRVTPAPQLPLQAPRSAVESLCSVRFRPCQLPSRLGDDHLRAQFMEFVPELLRFQAAGDFSHLLAGDDGGGGDQWLCA